MKLQKQLHNDSKITSKIQKNGSLPFLQSYLLAYVNSFGILTSELPCDLASQPTFLNK